MKGVKNYLKNVTKSIAYASSDIIKQDLMPNVGDFLETNQEFFAAAYSIAKNPKANIKKQVNSFTESKYYEAIDYGARNIFDDLKTGKFYNKEREDNDSLKFAGSSMNIDSWNDLSEFGIDDNWEEQLDSNKSDSDIVTAGDKEIVKSIESSNKAVANTTANAIAAAANMNNKNSRINTGILFNQNERLFGGLHSDISILNATVDSIHKVVSQSLPNLDKNIANYFTEASKDRKELIAMVKELIIRQTKSATDLEKEEREKRIKSSKMRWEDINVGGLPDFKAYATAVKGNISKMINSATGGAIDMMGEDSNMLAAMMANPLGGLMKTITKNLIPSAVKMATKELDKSLSGVFGSLIGRLGNAKNNEYDHPLLSKIAKIFGVDTSVNDKVDTSKYQKGAVPFDGITRKAIIDVIPTYLRRIEAAISGRQETLYDYDKASWKTVKSVKEEYNNIKKNSIKSASSEILGKMYRALNNIKKGMTNSDKQDFDKAIEEFQEYLYNHMEGPNPKRGAELNGVYAYNYPYLYEYWDLIMLAYCNYDYNTKTNKNTDLSTRLNISSNVLQARANANNQYRNFESSGHSAIGQVLTPGLTFDKHGTYDGNGKFSVKNTILAAKDNLGNNLFKYLQIMSAELKVLRSYAAGVVLSSSNKATINSPIARDLTDTDIKNLLTSKEEVEKQTKKFKDEANKQKESERSVIKSVQNNDTVDFELYKTNPKLYKEAMRAKIAADSTERQNSDKAAMDDENFITRMVNKYDGKSLKDLENVYDEASKNSKAVKKQEKDKSQTQILIDRAKLARAKFNAVIGSGSEVFTNLLYTADRAIYDMLFKAEIKDEDGERKEYKGFIDLISSKANDALDKIGEKTKSIFDPLIKTFGLDDKGAKLQDVFKNIGGKIVKSFVEANKEVYSPLYEKLMASFGVETKSKHLANTKSRIKSDSEKREYFKAHPEDIRLRRSAMKAVASGNYNIMEGHKDLLNTVEERREFLKNRIPEDKLKYYDDDAINKAYFRYIESTHAAGTTPTGKPFQGLSTLHKGEAVFNSKMSGVIDKTGLYNITEPTHILNRYDTNNLLGIKNTKSKDSTIKSDLLDEKKIKKEIYSHPDGTINSDDKSNKDNTSETINKAIDAAKQKYKDVKSIDFDQVKKNAKLYAPEGLAGGIIGGLATTLLGIVGGPIIGALLGSTAGIVSSSDTLKDKFFGSKDKDGKRNGGKVFGNKMMGFINKYVPDMKKYGLAGIIPGLITPFGPIGGMLIGSGIGYLKNNEQFMNKYFGPKDALGKRTGGKLTLDSQTQGLIKKMVPGAAKGASAGALASLVIGGPFGLLGSAAIGSALGIMTTSDEFKDGMLGKLKDGIRDGGLLGELRIAFNPLKDAAKKVADDMVETFDKYVVDPLSRFITPFVHQVNLALTFIPRKLAGVMENHIGKPIGSFINKHFITPFNKLLGGAVKKLSGGIKKLAFLNPFNLLGFAGDMMKRHQIKIGQGMAKNMTASERMATMTKGTKKQKGETDEHFNARLSASYKGYNRDAALASIGTKNGPTVNQAKNISNQIKALTSTRKQIERARKAKSAEIIKAIRYWKRDTSDARISDKAQTKIEDALKSDNLDEVELILKEWDLTDTKVGESRKMTDEEISDLMNGRNGKSGVAAQLSQFKDISKRKKMVDKFGAKDSKFHKKAEESMIKKLHDLGFKDVKSVSDLDKLAGLIDTEVTNREAHSRDKVTGKATDSVIDNKNADNINRSANTLEEIQNFLRDEILPTIKEAGNIFDKNGSVDDSKLDSNMDLKRSEETALDGKVDNTIKIIKFEKGRLGAYISRNLKNTEEFIGDKLYKAGEYVKGKSPDVKNKINSVMHPFKIKNQMKFHQKQDTINQEAQQTSEQAAAQAVQDAVPEHGIGTMILGGLAKGAGALIGGVKKVGSGILGVGKKAINSIRQAKAQKDINKLSKSSNPMITDEGATSISDNTVINPANGDAIKMKKDSDGSVEPDTSDSKTKSVLNKISIKEKFKEKLEQAQLKAAEVTDKAFGEQREGGKKLKWWQVLLAGFIAAPFIKKIFTRFINPLWKNKLKPWITKAWDNKIKPFISESWTTISTATTDLWNNKIKPFATDAWNDKIKPFFTDTVGPWITDTLIPRLEQGLGEAIAYSITHLPDLIKNVGTGFATVLDGASGNKFNAGTSKTVNGNDLSEKYGADTVTGMTDENGKKLTNADIANGNYKKIYNDDGVEGSVDDNGNINFKDQSPVGLSYAVTTGNAMAHGFAKSMATNKIDLLTKTTNKVAKKASKSKFLPTKLTGMVARAFTGPTEMAEKGGLKARALTDKYVDNVVGNMVNKAVKNGANGEELEQLSKAVANGDGSKFTQKVQKVADLTDNGIVGRTRDFVSEKVTNTKNYINNAKTKAKDKVKNTVKNGFNNVKNAVKNNSEKATEETIKNVAKETGEQATEKTIKNVAKETGKQATEETIKNVAKETGEEATKNAVSAAAKSTAETAAKETTEAATKSTIKTAAKETTEAVTKSTMKTAAKATGEEATKSAIETAGKNAAKSSSKTGGFLKKILTKLKEAISGLLDNSTVKSKLTSVAESLGQTASAKWFNGIKESIQGIFDDAIEKGIKKVGAETCKKVLSKVLTIVFLVTDFVAGADQAESILGVTETSVVEEFVAGLLNSLCNFFIIPSIFPGVNVLAQKVMGLFDKNFEERQKQAEEEFQAYKDENGSTLNKEEYLKRKYSVTGKVSGAISDAGKSIKKGFKSAGKGIAKGVKAAGKGIKKGFGAIGDALGSAKDKIGDALGSAKDKVTDFAGKAKDKVTGLAGKAKDKIGDVIGAAKDKAGNLIGKAKDVISDPKKAIEGVISKAKDKAEKLVDKAKDAISDPKKAIETVKSKVEDTVSNVKDSISNTIKEITNIKTKSDGVINKAENGKISPFGKKYWSLKSSKKGVAGKLEFAYNAFQRIIKLPIVMTSNVFNSVSSWFKKTKDSIVKKFSGIVSFVKDPIGSVKSLFGKGKKDSSSSSTGKGKYAKQIDPAIANIRFNAPGDTQYQTIGDSGCGPAAAVSAIKSAYGRGSNDIVSASKYALSNGYKEKNGGTKPQFFKDYFNKQGFNSSTTSNKSALKNNIKAGKPTVLMGKDSNGVSSKTPYGTNPHYITVTGVDGRGNAIVQDPESNRDDQLYKINTLLNKSSFGVSVNGRSKSRYGRSKYGMGLRGNCINEQAYNFFIDSGFSAAAAAGAVGNLMAEAGTDSNGQIDASSIESNGEGVGIVQWSYERKAGFLQYCNDHGNPFPNKDLALQLEYIMIELNSGDCWLKYNGYGHPEYLMSYPEFMKCNDVEKATGAWMSCYERPNAKYAHLDRRIQYATDIYNKYSGNAPIAGGSSSNGSSSSSVASTTESGFSGLINALGQTKAGKALSAFTSLLDGSSNDSSSSDSDSGSSGSSGGATVTGAAEKATAQMEAWAADDSHGYSQSNDRYGNPDFDCSGAVIQAWQNAGIDVKGAGASNTRDMYNAFIKMGFEDVTSQVNLNTGEGLQRGDILLAEGSHTGMWTGSGIVHASSSRGNPQGGDQGGKEFYVTDGFYVHSGGWDYALRYKTATDNTLDGADAAASVGSVLASNSSTASAGANAAKSIGSVLASSNKAPSNSIMDSVNSTGSILSTKKSNSSGVIMNAANSMTYDTAGFGKGKGGHSIASSIVNRITNPKYGMGMAKGALFSEDYGSREDSKYQALDAFKSYTNALTGKNIRRVPKKAIKRAPNYGKGIDDISTFNDISDDMQPRQSIPTTIPESNNNSNINYTALLNVIIQTLAAIADNTDKLNSIVALLNERLGTNITSSDVSQKSMNNQSIKSKLKGALLAQQNTDNYNNYSGNYNNSSMNVIINAMNAIASE